MIDAPPPGHSEAQASPAHEPQKAHVVAYLRHHQSRARQRIIAADDQRRLNVGKVTAERYDQAAREAPARMALLAAGQEQPIEPVRFGRDVERRPWIDPEQTNKFAKDPQLVHGFRRVDEMVRLQKRGTITIEHLAAGMRLRDDYEISEGAKVGPTLGGVRVAFAGAAVSQIQLDAMARYRAAIMAVGIRLSGILIAVVLQNRTVTSWSEQEDKSVHKAAGYLEAAMDCLFDHYRSRMEPK